MYESVLSTADETSNSNTLFWADTRPARFPFIFERNGQSARCYLKIITRGARSNTFMTDFVSRFDRAIALLVAIPGCFAHVASGGEADRVVF